MRFLRLLLGLQHPTRKELLATQDAIDALEARVNNHYRELKEVRGRVNAMRRWREVEQDPAAEPIPQSTEPTPAAPAPFPTDHLSRRFKAV